jgi:hypothetical protein
VDLTEVDQLMERFLDGAGEATESTDDTVKVEERSFPWFMAATVSTQPVERELCRAGLRHYWSDSIIEETSNERCAEPTLLQDLAKVAVAARLVHL